MHSIVSTFRKKERNPEDASPNFIAACWAQIVAQLLTDDGQLPPGGCVSWPHLSQPPTPQSQLPHVHFPRGAGWLLLGDTSLHFVKTPRRLALAMDMSELRTDTLPQF